MHQHPPWGTNPRPQVKGLALWRLSQAGLRETHSVSPKLVPSLHRTTAQTLQRHHLHLAVLPLVPSGADEVRSALAEALALPRFSLGQVASRARRTAPRLRLGHGAKSEQRRKHVTHISCEHVNQGIPAKLNVTATTVAVSESQVKLSATKGLRVFVGVFVGLLVAQASVKNLGFFLGRARPEKNQGFISLHGRVFLGSNVFFFLVVWFFLVVVRVFFSRILDIGDRRFVHVACTCFR